MKKLSIEDAFKNQNIEVIQNYIDIGFDFNTIDYTTQSYITTEIVALFDKNGLSFSEKQLLSSSDKRIFNEMFAADRDIFYKIFDKIVYHNWFDMYDWDWDVKRVFEKRMFNDVIERVIRSNNQEMMFILTEKLNEVNRFVFDCMRWLKERRNLEYSEELYTSIIMKEKHLFGSEQMEELIIDGYLELIVDVMASEYSSCNPLYVLIKHHLKHTLKVDAWDGVMGQLSDRDEDIFIRYFESFKYDFDRDFKIQVYDRKGIKANGQSFHMTPLIFLDMYVYHDKRNQLIKEALERSANIFNNKIFRIARTYERYNDEVLEFAGNYFEYFTGNAFQDIIFAKLTEEEFNKINSEKSKEALIKLAIKRDDFDVRNFVKWGFSPDNKFIDFLIKEIGEEKTREYNLIDIDDLLKNKDWCLEQLLENSISIIPKIDKTIIRDVIRNYSYIEGANAQIANELLKFHINYLLRMKSKYEWDYVGFADRHLKVDKKEFWDDVIEVVTLNKPKDINFKTLNEIFKHCMESDFEQTKEKFYTLSKANQNKIKAIGIKSDWMESEYGKFLVLDDRKYLKKKDDILESYLEKLNPEHLQTSLESGFEFKKSYGLFYYVAKLFRANSDFKAGIGGLYRIVVNDKNAHNYFDETTAAKIVNILLEYDFPNKRSLPPILDGSGQSNIIPSKNDIDYSVMLVAHLIFFRQSALLELFKKSFKSEYKRVMGQKGFGNSKGNLMHYLIENNIDDKKIIALIKDDVDAMQTDRYKRTWESFAIRTKFEV